MQKRIILDEEGFFVLENSVRLTDVKYGQTLLRNLSVDEKFAIWTHSAPNESILVEAFDKPLVVQNVIEVNGVLIASFPYDYKEPLDLMSLCLDDWGRLIGWTDRKVPFVFLRKAQTTFFEIVEPTSENTFDWRNRSYTLPKYFIPLDQAAHLAFWETHYKNNNIPWDLGAPHPAIEPVLQQVKLQKSRILNLGCGRGHDAHLLARKGHIVTGIDLSPLAIDEAKKNFPKPAHLTFEVDDVFKLKEPYKADIVFEHTLFCAIPPEKRKDLIRVWKNVLDDTGYLLGIFFVNPKRFGPPYGASEWELRDLLEPHFRLMYWKRWELSPPRRQGTEIVIFAQKY